MVIKDGVNDVTERLLLLASGLLERKIFRPFSSRDSHVMAQLKQSATGALRKSYTLKSLNEDNNMLLYNHQNNNKNEQHNIRYIKMIFDAALQAGKASRSSKVVPILDELRDQSKGADGPIKLSKIAAESAKTLAIKPVLKACVARFKAMEASESIAALQSSAKSLADEAGIDLKADDGKLLRRILHQPMVDLRDGKDIDKENILQMIQTEIDLSTF